MSKIITSSTALQPLEWYQKEISKAFRKVFDLGNEYRFKQKDYMKAQNKLFEKAYEVNKCPSKEGALIYKSEYKKLGEQFIELGKIYSEYKFNLDLLQSLKQEREKHYGKSREQSNEDNTRN